jgi:hypothetical protein
MAELDIFASKYPTMLSNAFERIRAIAKVVARGKYGAEIKGLIESVAIAGVIAGRLAGSHHYLSTACQHGLHDQCRKACKFCGALCACEGCKHGK